MTFGEYYGMMRVEKKKAGEHRNADRGNDLPASSDMGTKPERKANDRQEPDCKIAKQISCFYR